MTIFKGRKSISENFIWNLLGNTIYSLSQWGLIISMTRFGNLEMVGFYSLGLAITTPILMFTNLELRTIQATAESNYKFSNFLALRILTSILFIIILLTIVLIRNDDYYTTLIIFLIGISKIIESFSDLTYGVYQQKERMDFISISQIVRGVISFLVVTIVLLLTNSLPFALVALLLCGLFTFIFYDSIKIINFVSNVKPVYNFEIIKNIFLKSLPLGIAVMIVSLNINLPRLFIEGYISNQALGVYASIFYLVLIGSKFINAVGQAMLPRLANQHKKREYNLFNKTLLILLLFSLGIGVLSIIVSFYFGEVILLTIYGEAFVSYGNLLFLFMIYATLNFISYSLMIALNAIGSFKIQPYLGTFWLIISVFSLLYFVPKYELIGAALTLILYSVSRIVSISLVLIINLRKIRRFDITKKLVRKI